MKRKKFLIIIFLIILLFNLSGCYDARGIEDLAYATALGLDVSEEKMILLTFQFSIPSSGSESGSSQSNKTDSITVPCTSINSGLSLVNSYISKQVNLSHCKVIVISEKLAEQGISEYIDTLSNSIELRPDCNVIISKCQAKDFINNASPSIETLTARYYEIALNSSEYTGYTTSTKLLDFIDNTKSTFIQSSAILGALSSKDKSTAVSSDVSIGFDSHYTAGETPIDKSKSVETFGTAVFYEDKLVGELNGMETICYSLITNNLKSCTISVPDPFNSNSNVDLCIQQKRSPKIKVDIVNGSPYIYVELFLEAYGLSLNENTNYSSTSDIASLNSSAEDYLKIQLNNYLYKTSKEFKSDISGFGKYALSKYLTWDEWLESDWLNNYKNSFFDVNVNVNIVSGTKFNKTP